MRQAEANQVNIECSLTPCKINAALVDTFDILGNLVAVHFLTMLPSNLRQDVKPRLLIDPGARFFPAITSFISVRALANRLALEFHLCSPALLREWQAWQIGLRLAQS